MIAVKRPDNRNARTALGKAGRDGLTERARAIGHFTNGKPAKKPSFRAYKDDVVKDALNALFYHKCAYCESEYESVAPMDVEHFRPKGAYLLPTGKRSKKGYYWLAAEWTNLLPSCIDCNRERKQFRRTTDGKIEKSKSGKANKFPLSDEAKRAINPNGEGKEVPLLLDPCMDNPAKHLEFMDDGSVRPKLGANEKNLAKGQHSIEVYGLDRDGLLRERIKTMKYLKAQMNHICSYTLNVREAPQSARMKADLSRAKKELKGFSSRDSTYLALVKPMTLTFNGVLKKCEEYLDIKEGLLADPNNVIIDQQLQEKLQQIKRRAKPSSPAINLVKNVVTWMELLD